MQELDAMNESGIEEEVWNETPLRESVSFNISSKRG